MNIYDKIKEGVYVIAEMSANHGGSLKTALKIVEEAKKAGADCLKIQTYKADTLTINCDKDPFIIKNGLWKGYNYYQLYSEGSTPWEWQKQIKDRCEELGLDFLSTPFDNTAVDFLEELGVEAYKISSYELIDIPLIRYTASKGKTMIISCGMGSCDEIEEAVQTCKNVGNDKIILLKCCSQYPAQYDSMNLSVITDMIERFKLPVGLSDHSLGALAPIVAVSLGAKIIEKHICLKENVSVDSGFSMGAYEFAKMVKAVRDAVVIKGKPTYERTEAEKEGLASRRSLYAVKEIKEGEKFTKENIKSIRPAGGIKPKYYDKIIGKSAKKQYAFGEPIAENEIF